MTNFHIVALAGGVGGAKLADGLAQVLHPGQLTVIVNTADDFTHLGLKISPDLDTVCYTLAGMANPDTGWGRFAETWNVMKALKTLEMPDWFKIGDTDLATHIARTYRLGEGYPLSQITAEFCQQWGVKVKVLPMSDDVIQTRVYTDEGELGFQEYFVHRRYEPIVRKFRFDGIDNSKPAPGVLDAIRSSDAIIFCPSNPWVSIDPILLIPGIRQAIKKRPIVAVSPIIGSHSLKGPASKMFSELGVQPSAMAVAKHYKDLLNAIFIDSTDVDWHDRIEEEGIHVVLSNILMRDRVDRGTLAREILDYLSDTIKRDNK